MKEYPSVFVIIVNYNGKRVLSRCLRSVLQLEYARKSVVVVDNASTDGSLEMVREQFPLVHCLKNSENVGFARGANAGIRYALDQGASFLWILNPDAIVAKDSLGRLVALFRKHLNVGMISPVIYEPRHAYQHRRRVWFGGGRINWLRMRAEHVRVRSHRHPFETGYLSGCALLVRAEAFRSVGLFDERFFLYYEDADLSLRMRHGGWRVVVSPYASIVHSEESRHNPDKIYWLVRSGLSFFRKHTPQSLVFVFWTVFFIRVAVNRWHRLVHPDDSALLHIKRAFQDFRRYGY